MDNGVHLIKLITVDGCKGLHNAVDLIYPDTSLQLCWVHKLRNVTKYLPKKHREACKKQAQQIHLAKNRTMAIRIFKQRKKHGIALCQKQLPV